jgi:hypothetical protein
MKNFKEVKQLREKESKSSLLNINIENELESYLKETVKNQTTSQIESQQVLFTNWANEQSSELKQQNKNFQIDLKRAAILKRIGTLYKDKNKIFYIGFCYNYFAL